MTNSTTTTTTKPQMHPDMQALLDARETTNAQLGPRGEGADDARRWWNVYAANLAQPHPADMQVHDRTVPTHGGGYDVPVRIYQPGGTGTGTEAPAAAGIVYMHGGGFMMGDLDSSDSIAWGLAQETGATVVSVDYRLTPEHPYPAAFNDCYGVLTWLAADPQGLSIDASRIAVVGDSAGGNLAAAISLAARDQQGPKIAAQVLIYGSFGLDQSSGSYVEYAEGLGLTRASTQKYRDLYLSGNLASTDPYALPLRATSHAGLPPALVHSAEMDPIRDDGRTYAATLALAGNRVTYREAKGMIHGFLRARFGGASARAEFDAICQFLRAELAT